MITSKQIIGIFEEWFKDIPSPFGRSKTPVSIFVNPTSSDIGKLNKSFKESGNRLNEVRFIADAKSQKVYVFDSNLAIHDQVLPSLGLKYKDSNIILGDGKLFNGKIMFLDENLVGHSVESVLKYGKRPQVVKEEVVYLKQLFKYNWLWLDRYLIGIKNRLVELQNQFEKWNS